MLACLQKKVNIIGFIEREGLIVVGWIRDEKIISFISIFVSFWDVNEYGFC
jgi:hypothetical protein